MQNDNVLNLAIAGYEVWWVKLFLIVDTHSTADFKVKFSMITGGTFKWTDFQHTTEHRARNHHTEANTVNFVMGSDLSGDFQIIRLEGICEAGASAGNLQLQWAQNTAQAQDCKVKDGSFLIATKLL